MPVKTKINKDQMLRGMALFLTILCAITLQKVGEPRSFFVTLLRGLVLSLILNGSIWLCSFKFIRVRLKYFAAFFIFISGLGVFVISPYGWILAAFLLLFHLWLVVDLVVGKETM